VIWFKDRLCVPNVQSIRELILKEAHETAYSIHPGSEKMYQDLKKKFWWYGMKREIAAGESFAGVKLPPEGRGVLRCQAGGVSSPFPVDEGLSACAV
jgi:hypothetical protein